MNQSKTSLQRRTAQSPALLTCALLASLAASACTSGGGDKGETTPEQQNTDAIWDETSWDDGEWS